MATPFKFNPTVNAFTFKQPSTPPNNPVVQVNAKPDVQPPPQLTCLAQLQDVYSLNSYEKPRILRHFIDAGLTRLHFNIWVVERNNKVKAQKELLGIVPRFIVDPPEIRLQLDSIAEITDELLETLTIEVVNRDNARFMAKNAHIINSGISITNIRAFNEHSSSNNSSKFNNPSPSIIKPAPSIVNPSPSIVKSVPSIVKSVPSIVKSVPSIIKPSPPPAKLSISSNTLSSLIEPEQKLAPILEEPETLTANVFIDYSNLLVGLRSSWANTREENSRKHINVTRLCNIIHKSTESTNFGKKIVVGSNIADFTCADWRRNGYDIKQMIIPAGIKEKFVDEALHSCIAALLLAENAITQPQILVIGTGDGNETEGTNTFPNLAAAAARLGWTVIIWSWSYALNRKFKEVYESYPDHVIIKLLDEHAENITMTAPTGGLTPIARANPKKYL